jgi:hypothetical protein
MDYAHRNPSEVSTSSPETHLFDEVGKANFMLFEETRCVDLHWVTMWALPSF